MERLQQWFDDLFSGIPEGILPRWLRSVHTLIAIFTVLTLIAHIWLRYSLPDSPAVGWQAPANWPLLAALIIGGIPLVWELFTAMLRGQFGSDLLAGVSIVTSVFLQEYLAGAIVVLMLSGGQALEAYAVRSASSVLDALAKRVPSIAHRRKDDHWEEIPLAMVNPNDLLLIHPHAICPVDGEVIEGHGNMDESFLSGEPYAVPKTPGTAVISGAINGASALTIKALRRVEDSRYAKIMQVMQDSAQRRPKMRRLGDQLGALYTPLALAIALLAWWFSGEAMRFLAVLVVATPCPLLIGIPVTIIGSISLAARRSIIIKDPAILEQLDLIRVAMFDKTGTLTYGRPILTDVHETSAWNSETLVRMVASLEQYSKHPLSSAIVTEAKNRKLVLQNVDQVREEPGCGLIGQIAGHSIEVTSRKVLLQRLPESSSQLPATKSGLECVILIDGNYAGTFQFRDQPRSDGRNFVNHLQPSHGIQRVILVSGDRMEEVKYLAEQVGISEIYASQSPEQKLELVRKETAKNKTFFVGDGINDAPALAAATVGIAFGLGSEITSEAADAVILDNSLERVDELLHLGRRMRRIALQSAVGGMAVSIIGMLLAAMGWLPPVAGALVQETIDVIAVLNALRTAYPPKVLSDLDG
ncbi:MAG: Zinc-transporting ATPase [Planctomycetota bacterium]|jgi:heavy metal translocating P-type ATPase